MATHQRETSINRMSCKTERTQQRLFTQTYRFSPDISHLDRQAICDHFIRVSAKSFALRNIMRNAEANFGNPLAIELKSIEIPQIDLLTGRISLPISKSKLEQVSSLIYETANAKNKNSLLETLNTSYDNISNINHLELHKEKMDHVTGNILIRGFRCFPEILKNWATRLAAMPDSKNYITHHALQSICQMPNSPFSDYEYAQNFFVNKLQQFMLENPENALMMGQKIFEEFNLRACAHKTLRNEFAEIASTIDHIHIFNEIRLNFDMNQIEHHRSGIFDLNAIHQMDSHGENFRHSIQDGKSVDDYKKSIMQIQVETGHTFTQLNSLLNRT